MIKRIKIFLGNFSKDFTEAGSYQEFISEQLKRLPSRFVNFYNIINNEIRDWWFMRQTFSHLESKYIYEDLLGADGYKHFMHLIMTSSDKKQALLRVSQYLATVGLTDYIVKPMQTCLKKNPEDNVIHFYLQHLMFTSPGKFSHQFLYDEHVKYAKKLVSEKLYTDYPNLLTTNRRLKIGYTCHFITNSTSSTLLLPLLKAHNKDKVEVFMYSDQDPTQISTEVRNIVEHWRDTWNVNDNEFCDQVRKDQIDIMLELNGHCTINRYRALTRKPAPIQVNYYNYSATCGVPGIDYILVGDDVHIDALQPYFSEKIFHKKGVQLATIVSSHFVPVSNSPFIENGYITFGSFGQAHKVSREQISLWCEVLKRVPNSRFYMKANALDYSENYGVIQKHFNDHGIQSSRLILEGGSDYATLLQSYAKMDIGLDTYPFGAGTTTIEACIQGVPVVSLLGERFSAKHGFINLNSIGHAELLAHSKSEFIDIAVNLANDHDQLIHYRHTLREDVVNSQRGDMNRFIRELEEAYQLMWAEYI